VKLPKQAFIIIEFQGISYGNTTVLPGVLWWGCRVDAAGCGAQGISPLAAPNQRPAALSSRKITGGNPSDSTHPCV
jgi:hypothetical protein